MGFSVGGGRCGAGGLRRGGGLAAGSGCEGGVRTRPAAEVKYVFASLICLKRSVASSTFVGLRSGWYINANLRNAFFMDASSAVSGRPRAFRCFVRADVAIVSRGAGVCAPTLGQFRPRGAGGVRAAPGLASLLGQPKAA